MIDEAFLAYIDWYNLAKREGINNLLVKDIDPLSKSSIRWYR